MRIASLTVVIAMALAGAGTALADEAGRRIVPIQNSNNGWVRPKPKEGFRYPDCFCTDSSGQRVEMGQTACLKIGSREFTARCDMSLNNPAWRQVQEGCPTS